MFVFDVICSVHLRNAYVIVLKSVSHMFLLITVRLSRTRLKCDKDHMFTTIYRQSLNPQHFFLKCIIQLMAIVTATTGTLPS